MPKSNWMDEFICVRSKAYSFECKNENKNKLKRICKSEVKSIKFEEYYTCLFGREYQK